MPELIVSLKGREIRRHAISKTHTAIGRHPTNEVVIDNPGVSRVHALVRYEGGGFVLSDAGSSNGVFVNGAACAGDHRLVDGDAIQVGKFSIVFSASADEGVQELERNEPPPAPADVSAKLGPDRTSQLKAHEIQRFLEDGGLEASSPRPLEPSPSQRTSLPDANSGYRGLEGSLDARPTPRAGASRGLLYGALAGAVALGLVALALLR